MMGQRQELGVISTEITDLGCKLDLFLPRIMKLFSSHINLKVRLLFGVLVQHSDIGTNFSRECRKFC